MSKKNFYTTHILFHELLFKGLKESFLLYQSNELEKSISRLLEFQYIIYWHIGFEEGKIFTEENTRLIDRFSEAAAYKTFQYKRDHKLIKDKLSNLFIALITQSDRVKISFLFVSLIDLIEHHDERENNGYLKIIEKKFTIEKSDRIQQAFVTEMDRLAFKSKTDISELLEISNLFLALSKDQNTKKIIDKIKEIDDIILNKAVENLKELSLTSDLINRYKVLKKIHVLICSYFKKRIKNESY